MKGDGNMNCERIYQNIKNGIFFYKQENPDCKRYRIDAVAIVLEPKLEIKHLKNV